MFTPERSHNVRYTTCRHGSEPSSARGGCRTSKGQELGFQPEREVPDVPDPQHCRLAIEIGRINRNWTKLQRPGIDIVNVTSWLLEITVIILLLEWMEIEGETPMLRCSMPENKRNGFLRALAEHLLTRRRRGKKLKNVEHLLTSMLHHGTVPQSLTASLSLMCAQ